MTRHTIIAHTRSLLAGACLHQAVPPLPMFGPHCLKIFRGRHLLDLFDSIARLHSGMSHYTINQLPVMTVRSQINEDTWPNCFERVIASTSRGVNLMFANM